MEEKPNQRVMLTKRLLKDALIDILRRKRIEQVSVTELCREAGLNRSTFYAHYSIPLDVLADIKEDFADEMIASLGLSGDEADPRHHLECICRFIYENRGLERIILSNSSDDEVFAAALESTFRVWGTTSPFLHVQGMDETSQNLVAAFYYHGILCVIREWVKRDLKKTPEDIAEIMYRILFGG